MSRPSPSLSSLVLVVERYDYAWASGNSASSPVGIADMIAR